MDGVVSELDTPPREAALPAEGARPAIHPRMFASSSSARFYAQRAPGITAFLTAASIPPAGPYPSMLGATSWLLPGGAGAILRTRSWSPARQYARRVQAPGRSPPR